MQQRAFAEKFLKHLDKIDPVEVESFILRTVKERDFTARIFETLVEGVVVFDADCRISLVNTAACRILHWPRGRRIVGDNLLDLVDAGPLRDRIEAFLRDPRPLRNEEIVLRPRSKKVYNLHLLPLAPDEDAPEPPETAAGDTNLAPNAAALVLQDLTPSLTRQQRESQERKIASLATLTAGVAHDIKNPLNSLSIHAQLLERSAQDFAGRLEAPPSKALERISHSCAAIAEEVERLRGCVDDFIEAARPHEPNLEMNDLNAIVRSTADMAHLEFEARQIQIETYLDPDLPTLPLDEGQFQHLLRNLLRNSLEAILSARRPPGQGQVVLRTRLGDDVVVLEVCDNGAGIAKADMPKVFEPYFTTKFNGSGLGLMAVGRIVREHGGQISVTSTEEEETTFTIELPVVTRRIRLLEQK